MSRYIIFEDRLTCGCSVELSLLENHVKSCIILNERSVSEVQRRRKLDVDVDKVKQYLGKHLISFRLHKLEHPSG